MIKLTLPIPISVNDAYLNVKNKWSPKARGRALTKDAQNWKEAAIIALMRYRKPFIEGKPRYDITYRFIFGTEHRRDIANYEKILTDLLVERKFILDDSYIERIVLIRCPVEKSKSRVEVEISLL